MKVKFPNFSQNAVLVTGDLMLDRYWQGSTARISPEAPVPVVKIQECSHRAGGAGNVALNIAALNGKVVLLGLTGKDAEAEQLRNCLVPENVACEFLTLPDKPTITKLRVLSRHQQLIRLDFEDSFYDVDDRELKTRFQHLLPGSQAVVLSDYGKGTLKDAPALIAMARQAGKPVLVDPKGRDFEIYRYASLITPNQSEFEAVVGVCGNDTDLLTKGSRLRRSLELDALLVTRSEKGMVLFTAAEQPFVIPALAREVFDVTGAGDTVIAVFAAALAAGETWLDAAQLANLAAGVVVGKLGTATASPAELQRAMLAHTPLMQGVVDEHVLLELIVQAKASGERIVLTNGCFDILHAGHVAYLAQAANLGDRLIVAVNDDASVQRLKGNHRPVNGLKQRMAVLASLASVDWVVPFSEDTPARLIAAVAPDVLVKGGDYRPEQIAGADSVQRNGGKVVVLDFLDGHSTSAIIQSIKTQC